MKPLKRLLFAPTAFVVALMLVGCAGSQSLDTQSFARSSSLRVSPATSGDDLIYMAQGDEVGIYSFAGKEVGELKGLDGVQGLCSDSQGNVWVTYGGALLEYARGGTEPIAEVYTLYATFGCAVDPTTGDLAVTEDTDEGQGNVVVFQNIYGTPQTYTDPDLSSYAYATYDDQGNLVVNGRKGKKPVLAELPSGSGTLGTISVDEKLQQLGGLQWDGQYVALGDSLAHVVYQLSIANGHATTESTTHFKDWGINRFRTIEPFAIADGTIILTFSDRQTGFWEFPAGGRSTSRIDVVTGAKTVSVGSNGFRGGKR